MVLKNVSWVNGASVLADVADVEDNPNTNNANKLLVLNSVGKIDEEFIGDIPTTYTRVENISTNTILSSLHSNKYLHCTNATPITITLPSEYLADIGTEIEIARNGVGTVTINSSGGVTIALSGSVETSFDILARYLTCTLKKVEANLWILYGDVD